MAGRTRASSYNDMYGRRSLSEPQRPGYPTYDPGGSGQEFPGLREDPWKNVFGSTTAAMQLASLASLPPGAWKALSLGAAAPFLGFLGNDVYRSAQQINGDHPMQLEQGQWENALGRAMQNSRQRGGY